MNVFVQKKIEIASTKINFAGEIKVENRGFYGYGFKNQYDRILCGSKKISARLC